MTTWKIVVTETKPGTGLHTTGNVPVVCTLLDLAVRNQRLAAATLRALADELDPPRPAYRPAYRRADNPAMTDDPGPEVQRDPALPRCRALHPDDDQRCKRNAHGNTGHRRTWIAGNSNGKFTWDGPGGMPAAIEAPGV